MKLKTILVSLAILMSAITASFSGLAYLSIGDLSDGLAKNASAAKSYSSLLNETRIAQVAFQIQVQEWKNILIRGNDKELYAKHFKGFEEQERNMNERLNSMRAEMALVNINTSNVDTLLAAHAGLGAKYRDALKTWVPEDEMTGKAVDKLLRGIDRPTSAALSDFAAQIEKEAIVNLSLTSDKAVANSKTAIATFLSVAAFAFVFALLLCFAVGRNVFGKVGGEPSELAESFSFIAQGDFSRPILVKTGDKASLAAHAGVMQMHVRSMLRAITNGSQELERSTDKIKIDSTTEEVHAVLGEARKAVQGLLAAANRFKV